jgi:hypothetical protein
MIGPISFACFGAFLTSCAMLFRFGYPHDFIDLHEPMDKNSDRFRPPVLRFTKAFAGGNIRVKHPTAVGRQVPHEAPFVVD